MALILLIVLGATLGWVGSIVTRAEAPREIGIHIGLATLAALIAGLAVNKGGFLGSLSLVALAAAILAAGAALAAYHFWRQRSVAA